MLQAAPAHGSGVRGRKGKPMGEKLLNYLVTKGYLSRTAADALHKEHMESGRSIRELIAEQSSVSEEHMLEALRGGII